MAWKILITARTLDAVGQAAVASLRGAGCELTSNPGPHAAEVLRPLLEGHDACYASTDKFTAEVLSSPQASRLKCISRWGVGYDSIDVGAATQNGIVVSYTPGLLDEAVADFAFALMLTMSRRLHVGYDNMRQGVWRGEWGHDVHGKTLGILGCGRIGLAVARRAAGFGLRVIASDPRQSPEAARIGVTFVPLDELLARSDYLSLHAALTPQTREMIGAAELRKMKRSAYLINTGRGPLVEEAALVRALHDGVIAGAALDTFVVEPLPWEHPLRKCPNVLLTPHLAGFSRETGERVSAVSARALLDVMNGRKPPLVVNPEVFASPALRMRLTG